MSGRSRIRIGTSGWDYTHWRGRFYPKDEPREEWFRTYVLSFETVEINNTFYQQPGPDTLDAWRRQAPRGFRYAVKAHRYITHLKRLKDPEAPLDRFFAAVRRLGSSLGPVLYQLPPNWNPNHERLESFVEQLPGDLVHVIEFRNRAWLDSPTYRLLANGGIALCVHDLLPRHPRRVTGPIAYVRLHGAGKKYGGRYRKQQLESWARWIRDVSSDHEVFVYFNNDQGAHAVSDARRLGDMIEP